MRHTEEQKKKVRLKRVRDTTYYGKNKKKL